MTLALLTPEDIFILTGCFVIAFILLSLLARLQKNGPARERVERAEPVDFRAELHCIGGPPPLGKEHVGVDVHTGGRRAA